MNQTCAKPGSNLRTEGHKERANINSQTAFTRNRAQEATVQGAQMNNSQISFARNRTLARWVQRALSAKRCVRKLALAKITEGGGRLKQLSYPASQAERHRQIF